MRTLAISDKESHLTIKASQNIFDSPGSDKYPDYYEGSEGPIWDHLKNLKLLLRQKNGWK